VNRCEPQFEEYNDNNINHVIAGPDYGQSGDVILAWDLKKSEEENQWLKSALSSRINLLPLTYYT
jgi:hypothetical protein